MSAPACATTLQVTVDSRPCLSSNNMLRLASTITVPQVACADQPEPEPEALTRSVHSRTHAALITHAGLQCATKEAAFLPYVQNRVR